MSPDNKDKKLEDLETPYVHDQMYEINGVLYEIPDGVNGTPRTSDETRPEKF